MAPMLIQRNLGCLTFGVAKYSRATMRTTTASSAGHFAMFHTFTAVAPSPTAFPTALAAGPVSTSPSATRAVRRTVMRVTTSIVGRSFQIGRPSSIS